MEFEWDSTKVSINLKKHGVSFSEAQTVFDDPLACIFDDEWNSFGQQRELIIRLLKRQATFNCIIYRNDCRELFG